MASTDLLEVRSENPNFFTEQWSILQHGYVGLIMIWYILSSNRHRKIKMINNNVQSLFKFNNKLWESGGSTVFTKTLREYCQIPFSHKGQITGIYLD